MFYSALTALIITTSWLLYNQAHSDIALKIMTKKINASTFHIHCVSMKANEFVRAPVRITPCSHIAAS